MAYKPVIRQDDSDTGGFKSIPTQFALTLDDEGNLKSSGRVDATGGMRAGDAAGARLNLSATKTLEELGIQLADGPSTRAIGGSVIVAGGTVTATGGGGVAVLNNSAGGEGLFVNSGGGLVQINNGGDTRVYINNPSGSAVDCTENIIKSEAAQSNAQVDMSEGNPSDPGQPQTNNRANSGNGGGGSGGGAGGGAGCMSSGSSVGSSMEGDLSQSTPNAITNASVPVNAENGEVSEQMELGKGTEENPNPSTTSWRMSGAPDSLTLDESTGLLSGTVPEGEKYNVSVTATDATSGVDLDTKTYEVENPEVPSNDGTAASQKMIAPLSKAWKVDSKWGPRSCSGCSSYHKGWDFNGTGGGDSDRGDPVVSTLDGVVSYNGYINGYGNMVIVDHYDGNGKVFLSTGYAHLDEPGAAVGTSVSQGTQIGKLGSSGGNYAAHLHYEVSAKPNGGTGYTGYKKGLRDPANFMNGQDMQVATQAGGYQYNSQGGQYAGNSASGCTSPSYPSGNCSESSGDPVDEAKNEESGASEGSETETPTTPETPETAAGIRSLNTSLAYSSLHPLYGIPHKEPDQSSPIVTPTSMGCDGEYTVVEVINRMRDVLDADDDLDEPDKEVILFIARIESGFDPCAALKIGSTALGLFQMIESTVEAYPHERVDIEDSTKAFIEFYKKELRRYWDNFQASNGTRLGRALPIRNKLRRDTFKTYNKLEFIYGLIFHDGVRNALDGNNQGGVGYAQYKMEEFIANPLILADTDEVTVPTEKTVTLETEKRSTTRPPFNSTR